MTIIGIDLGGTRIKIGLWHEGEISAIEILKSESQKGLLFHLEQIDAVIERLLKTKNNPPLDGVSLAFPGLVNTETKRIVATNQKYDDATEIDLESYYNQKWNAAFFIDNDSRLAAIGEWKYGVGKGFDDIVMVTFGTGIGTGVIMEGKLIRGKHYQAGCLGGHIIVNYEGRKCSCGNIGCVEAEASTWNLDDQLRADPLFSHSQLAHQKNIDYEYLFQMAREGDPLAIKFRNRCLKIWSAGIINYIHAYDPEIVILGGGILNSSQDIIPILQQNIDQFAWTPWGKVILKLSELKEKASILGGVYSLNSNPELSAEGRIKYIL